MMKNNPGMAKEMGEKMAAKMGMGGAGMGGMPGMGGKGRFA